MRNLSAIGWLAKILLLLSSVASGAEIVGPSKVEPYRLARFSAKGGEKSSFSWAVSPRGKTDSISCKDADFAFVGPPGSYEVELLEIGPTGDPAKPFSLERTYHAVTIGEAPDPEPGPEPGPKPPAPLPDGKFGLAKLARDWAGQVQGSTVRAEVQSLAGSFSQQAASLQAAIAAGVAVPTAEILANCKTANREALGSRADAWKAAFFEPLAKKLEQLYDGKQVNGAADFQAAFEEIALGLKAVK